MTDLTRFRGDTYADEINVVDSGGAAIDVTDYTFVMTVDPDRAPTDSSNNLFQIAGNIIDAENGVVQFAPSAVQADQAPGTYQYDIQMTDADGFIRTIVQGRYKFVQDITKN